MIASRLPVELSSCEFFLAVQPSTQERGEKCGLAPTQDGSSYRGELLADASRS